MDSPLLILVIITVQIAIIAAAINWVAGRLGLRKTVEYERFAELMSSLERPIVVDIAYSINGTRLGAIYGGWRIYTLAPPGTKFPDGWEVIS